MYGSASRSEYSNSTIISECNMSAESVVDDAERYALSKECKLEILAGCPLLSSIDLVLYSMKGYY
jgi:hypothetical protein